MTINGFAGVAMPILGKKQTNKKVCFVQNSSGVVLKDCDILTCQRLHHDDICKSFGWKQRRKFINIHLQSHELNISFLWKGKDFFVQLQQQSLFSIKFFCSKMNSFSKLSQVFSLSIPVTKSKLWYK